MSEIGDILGEEFEQEYNETAEQRRETARKVDSDTLKEICYEAIKAGRWKGEEPRFVFEGDNIDHDVVLLEAPRENISKFRHPFNDSEGISMGMFHQGRLWNAIFNENLADVVDRIEEGEAYLVVGRYQERNYTDNDGNEQTALQIAPVRGILPLAKAKEFAEQYEQQMEGTTVEEQAQQQQQQVQSDDDEDSLDLGGGEPEQASEEDILKVFKAAASQREDVVRGVGSGDEDDIDTLVDLVDTHTDGEVTRDLVIELFEEHVQEIDWPEEEEDDELDLGGEDTSDSDDDDSIEDMMMGGGDGESSSNESSDDGEDEEDTDVSDWF